MNATHQVEVTKYFLSPTSLDDFGQVLRDFGLTASLADTTGHDYTDGRKVYIVRGTEAAVKAFRNTQSLVGSVRPI